MVRLKKGYHKVQPGEWIAPRRRGYRLACCDCGLVHKLDFTVRNNQILFRAFRLPRATAQVRRTPHPFQETSQ